MLFYILPLFGVDSRPKVHPVLLVEKSFNQQGFHRGVEVFKKSSFGKNAEAKEAPRLAPPSTKRTICVPIVDETATDIAGLGEFLVGPLACGVAMVAI